MATVEEILESARKLPYCERARLADELLRTLDPPGEDISEKEWQEA